MKIQLLYFVGCPHVEAMRRVLRAALQEVGVADAPVEEVDVEHASTPPALRGWGSPTLLIDGMDIAGEPAPTGLSCRLYPGGDSPGVPSRAQIVNRLRRAIGSR